MKEQGDRLYFLISCSNLQYFQNKKYSIFQDIKVPILNILQSVYDITEKDAKELMRLSELEREESLDLWQFTNLINQNYTREEKVKVAEKLWNIVYSDGKVDQHEEYLMRKLTYLLGPQNP